MTYRESRREHRHLFSPEGSHDPRHGTSLPDAGGRELPRCVEPLADNVGQLAQLVGVNEDRVAAFGTKHCLNESACLLRWLGQERVARVWRQAVAVPDGPRRAGRAGPVLGPASRRVLAASVVWPSGSSSSATASRPTWAAPGSDVRDRRRRLKRDPSHSLAHSARRPRSWATTRTRPVPTATAPVARGTGRAPRPSRAHQPRPRRADRGARTR